MDKIPDLPPWLVIIVALLGAIGTFWEKLKSFFVKKLEGQQNIELKKLESDLEEMDSLRKKVSVLERNNIRLLKSNTALSMAMTFMIDEYSKTNPDNETVIKQVQALIKEALAYQHDVQRPTDQA